MSTTCHVSHVILASYLVSQNARCTTKAKTVSICVSNADTKRATLAEQSVVMVINSSLFWFSKESMVDAYNDISNEMVRNSWKHVEYSWFDN